MDVVMWVLFGVLPAIAVMLIGVGVFGARWLAIALAVAVCVPFGMADGWPTWPWLLDLHHGDPRAWLWWMLLLGGAIGSLYDRKWLPGPVALAGEAVLVVMLPWLLSAPLRAGWSFETCVLYLSAGWVLQAAIWWAVRAAAKAREGMAVPLAMTIVLGVDAWLLRENSGGAAWQLAGVAAIALCFSVVTTCWVRPFVCGTGAAQVVTLLHTGLLFCGRSERELLQLPFVLALCAPLPLAVGTLAWFRNAPAAGAIAGVAGVAAVGAWAVAGA